MNKIFWDKDKITIITDQIEAVEHKHCAMQFFFCLEKRLDICVSGQKLKCKCIVVNQNVTHSFSAEKHLHISIIIEPTSDLGKQLSKKINGNTHYIIDNKNLTGVEYYGYRLMDNSNTENYNIFVQASYDYLGISLKSAKYDDRINEVLHYIEHCDYSAHSISSFAYKISLSTSRLSHLFREQVGIPLKSYIQLHQLQKAFLSLLNGKSITEAAMLANFDTPSHFAAVTKRMMGTPASISLKNSEFLKVF